MNKLTMHYFVIMNVVMILISIVVVPLFMNSISYSSIYGQQAYDNLSPDWKQIADEKQENWTFVAQIIPFLGGNIVLSFYLFVLRTFETPNTVKNNEPDKRELELQEWRNDDLKRKEQNKKASDLILKKYESLPDLNDKGSQKLREVAEN